MPQRSPHQMTILRIQHSATTFNSVPSRKLTKTCIRSFLSLPNRPEQLYMNRKLWFPRRKRQRPTAPNNVRKRTWNPLILLLWVCLAMLWKIGGSRGISSRIISKGMGSRCRKIRLVEGLFRLREIRINCVAVCSLKQTLMDLWLGW